MSLESGERFEVPDRCRVVDARYLAPDIPAELPPKFEVAAGARVIPVNDLPAWEGTTSQYVIVGSGKTATDSLRLAAGPRRRSRRDLLGAAARPVDAEPGVIQRTRFIYLGMVADVMRLVAEARSLQELSSSLRTRGSCCGSTNR